MSGLKTALDLAERGLGATIVGKSPFLGGQVAHLDRLAPTGEKAGEVVAELADAVLGHPAITVLTCAQVEAFEGYVGNFKLTVVKGLPAGTEYAAAARRSRCPRP